jgi:ketosteroid isomerase-like protein
MSEKEFLMSLDVQFCNDCKINGEKAWASYFMDSGFMVVNGYHDNIIGKEKIEKAMEGIFSLQDIEFDWHPVFCEISDDNTLGVTMGESTRTFIKDNEKVTLKGKYTTIWKKVEGTWKIVWDIGN